MSSLNVMCAICTEFYTASDAVDSTPCGHLFHHQCLARWIRPGNSSCPQCRRMFHRIQIHRVFLNFGERTIDDVESDYSAFVSNTPIWIPLEVTGTDGSPQAVPDGAIKCGVDVDGNDAYVARAYYQDDLLPANYVPQRGGAYTPWGCHAHFLRSNVEILIECPCEWVQDSNGHVPENAIVSGYTDSGEDLYTGRAQYRGITLAGKIHPSHRVLYMPYNGQEVNTQQYEVLVQLPKPVVATTNDQP